MNERDRALESAILIAITIDDQKTLRNATSIGPGQGQGHGNAGKTERSGVNDTATAHTSHAMEISNSGFYFTSFLHMKSSNFFFHVRQIQVFDLSRMPKFLFQCLLLCLLDPVTSELSHALVSAVKPKSDRILVRPLLRFKFNCSPQCPLIYVNTVHVGYQIENAFNSIDRF